MLISWELYKEGAGWISKFLSDGLRRMDMKLAIPSMNWNHRYNEDWEYVDK